MHEHLLIDVSPQYSPPAEPPPADGRVSLENFGYIRWNVNGLRDNLLIDDPDLIVAELADMRELGASGVVDLTINGLGPRVDELVGISERTGLHLMIGCGFYIDPSHPDWVREADVDTLVEFFLDELANGVGGTNIRPALVGELGTSDPVTPSERKVVAAGGRAAAETGAALNIHLDPRGSRALEVLELLVSEGMQPGRVIFSHLDERIDRAYYEAIAEAGAVLEFDTFGQEWYYSPDRFKDPSDVERCIEVQHLVRAGYGDQLVLACDVCMKSCLKAYGGVGYDHLFRRIVPLLADHYDLSAEELDRMLIHTPRRLLDRPAA
jgi:phosphotriesterase-related protein